MNKTPDLETHYDLRGCCLDFTSFKMNDRVDIVLGYICDQCREALIQKIGKEYYSDIASILSREWIGEVDKFGTVAYNLKNYFKFDINKDSGFNKTLWEKLRDRFDEILSQSIVALFTAIIGLILGYFVGKS